MKILLLFAGAALVLCFVPRRFLGIVKWPLVLSLLVAGFVIMPAGSFNREEQADETFDVASIATYQAHFALSRSGVLDVTEQVLVSFPVAKHGIFRFFDIVDPSAPHARRIPEGITVLRDGKPEPVDFSDRGHGRFRVVRIGSPDVELQGMHTYTIKYRIRGVIEPGTTGARSQFYWDLIPGGWAMSIDRSTVTVDLPVPADEQVRCAIGFGQSDGCAVAGAGGRTLTIRTGYLKPRTPVTIKTGLDLPTPPGTSVPWTGRWDPVLGRDLTSALVIAALAVVAGGFGWRLRLRAHESEPGFPVMYAPPTGLGPAQAVYVMDERVGRDQFIATVLHAAERGAISLSRGSEDQWRLHSESPKVWRDLDVVTQEVGTSLNIRKAGTMEVGPGKVKPGKKLQDAEHDLPAACRRWAKDAGLLADLAGTSAAGWFGILALVVAVLWAMINPFDLALMAAIPAAFGAPAAMLVAGPAATVRTAAGRRLWSEIGGFKRMLSTDSSEQRFDFSARKDLYTAYIPWAVAFGVADAWARKYRSETGEEPPMPQFLPSSTSESGSITSTSSAVTAMSASFGAAVGAAIGAYTASIAPSSSSGGSSFSSGGGGGFSGGGGGGGGGGGSW